MSKIKINKQGFVNSPYINDATQEVEVTEEQFKMVSSIPDYKAWKYQNGELFLVDLVNEDILRDRRQKECFDIIDNRSVLWWNNLTDKQKTLLNNWYKEWLDVTKTMIIPELPDFLK